MHKKSRNARLSPEARAKAVAISAALRWAEAGVADGSVVDAAAVVAEVTRRIEDAGGQVDYVSVSNADHLQPLPDGVPLAAQPSLLAVAANFAAKDRGAVRLIDNTVLGPPLPE